MTMHQLQKLFSTDCHEKMIYILLTGTSQHLHRQVSYNVKTLEDRQHCNQDLKQVPPE